MSSTNPPKRDFRQEVTDNIIKMLEQGTAPWQKPWEPGALEMPFNPMSDRQYRGANAINLMAVGVSLGLEGVWYDSFHAHGPAIAVSLATIPISLVALIFLPEPAGRTLEDISRA